MKTLALLFSGFSLGAVLVAQAPTYSIDDILKSKVDSELVSSSASGANTRYTLRVAAFDAIGKNRVPLRKPKEPVQLTMGGSGVIGVVVSVTPKYYAARPSQSEGDTRYVIDVDDFVPKLTKGTLSLRNGSTISYWTTK